jgi:hypothetical protein
MTAAAAALCSLGIGACGSSTQSAAPTAAKSDVIVTLDGVHRACVVALNSEAQGSTIPCSDVVAFLKDELRVPSGSVYDIRTIPEVDAAEKTRVEAALKAAGYRSSDAAMQRE